ncbi:hypothetical protein J6590_029009 [Homalodisca vitripennis]|nr:hypothetical protein J6590_029009 [Homalodisca vitripennis]
MWWLGREERWMTVESPDKSIELETFLGGRLVSLMRSTKPSATMRRKDLSSRVEGTQVTMRRPLLAANRGVRYSASTVSGSHHVIINLLKHALLLSPALDSSPAAVIPSPPPPSVMISSSPNDH